MKRVLATLVVLTLLLVNQAPLQAGPNRASPLPAPAHLATITVDGVIDAAYGSPIAMDQAGDGNGNAIMDLRSLYVAEDATSYYFAFTVNADIGAANWGKYALYVDTDGVAGSGATSDAWTRNVRATDPHKPEYGIYTWVDSPPYNPGHTQVVHWTGAGWDWGGVQQVDACAIGAGATSVIEWQVAKSKLGNPTAMWLEVWSTGGGGGDNAQDTINFPAEDWNATDWSTQALLLVSTPYIAIDGVHEETWGAPIATDPLGDMTEPNLDLHRLYAVQNASYYYFGLDAYASTWGMTYGIYLDTDQVSGSGATSDPWGRAVNAVADHRPESTIYVYHEDTDVLQNAQLNHWTGSWSYDSLISQGGTQGYNGANDWLEYQVPKSTLGNPTRIALEAFTTGGSGHAQDTVASDPNVAYTVPDWGSAITTLSAFTTFPAPALSLSLTWPPEGYFFSTPDIQVLGQVSPAVGVTLTVNLNGTNVYQPAVDSTGHFTQPVTLVHGSNTITATATDGSATATAVRHVTFGASHDNNVFWDGLYHDTRDALYRTPSGAIPTGKPGKPVTLRLRAYTDDLTAVKLRVWDDRTDTASLYSMHIAATDGVYDYWEYTVPAQTLPTVLWYRFIAQDGTAVAYYEDDTIESDVYRGYNEGGPGKVYATSPDYSFQITVYDPAYHTPDWMKNAVVYQILPDRFRDGNSSNDVVSGTHFIYGNAAGGITYPAWTSPVINPRDPTSPYANRWSEDFYGGDLQGITDKLGYLQSQGVTAIYLNPIFLSPSNHKYDTTSFEEVDPHLGGNQALATLLSAAQARGMHVILDGVFNHTSSDSIYFDKYSRYPSAGAYESQVSPYFGWYTFSNWPTQYNSWWGYDTLPVLKSSNPAVRTYIYSGTNAIATRWVISGTAGWRLDVGGDIDPGVTRDPTNRYWEEFRQAVKATDPNAVIIGEEWGDASPWLLGGEWDAVMNYRFRSAVLSFLRDRHFEDNDNNTGSSGGVLDPITPSQLDAWLHSIQEDYPPEAWQAMMNLLGSHDTGRVRFILSKSQLADDTTHVGYNPATDYDSNTVDSYQKTLALLQFTLPGAPTVYYGDEVGVESPDYWANNQWEDDPYNRVPFPWSEKPGYYSQRAGMSTYYATLGQARAAHPALRTGDFRTLLTDDANMVYAYGRKLAPDAAVVIVNRGTAARTVTVDVRGYIGDGALLATWCTVASPIPSSEARSLCPTFPRRAALCWCCTAAV